MQNHYQRLLWGAAIAGAIAGALLCLPRPVRAASTWTVTSTGDGSANPANCPSATLCRLRDALANAGNGDTINFSVTVPAVITLVSGQLNTHSSIAIVGPGANNLTLNGNNTSRIFFFNNSTANVVSISGLTITNGKETSGDSAVLNNDTLTLSGVTVISNTSGPACSGCGGAISSAAAI